MMKLAQDLRPGDVIAHLKWRIADNIGYRYDVVIRSYPKDSENWTILCAPVQSAEPKIKELTLRRTAEMNVTDGPGLAMPDDFHTAVLEPIEPPTIAELARGLALAMNWAGVTIGPHEVESSDYDIKTAAGILTRAKRTGLV